MLWVVDDDIESSYKIVPYIFDLVVSVVGFLLVSFIK